MNEAMKIKPKIEKYLTGKILDFGCGEIKITKDAIGIDTRPLNGINVILDNVNDIYFPEKYSELYDADTIFSSHFLEHITSPYLFIAKSTCVLKKDGYLVLYLPDGAHYDDVSNPEHLHTFRYKIFLRWFEATFKDVYDIIESGEDIGLDRYSFYIVARKK